MNIEAIFNKKYMVRQTLFDGNVSGQAQTDVIAVPTPNAVVFVYNRGSNPIQASINSMYKVSYGVYIPISGSIIDVQPQSVGIYNITTFTPWVSVSLSGNSSVKVEIVMLA